MARGIIATLNEKIPTRASHSKESSSYYILSDLIKEALYKTYFAKLPQDLTTWAH